MKDDDYDDDDDDMVGEFKFERLIGFGCLCIFG